VRDAPRVTDEQLLRFHTPGHLKKIFGACATAEKKKRVVDLDGDTSVMAGTAEAATRAAGAACAAVDAVMSGKAASAFVAVRPPGHHAEPDAAMGFCLFGNAGVAALHGLEAYRLSRVAVVDWDVHHGNGTQAKFEKDPRVFFASSHQMPCYPGTGHPRETGVSNNVVNCGLKPGTGSAAFREAWGGKILPALRAFRPELIVVSAGFDAHGDDPLAELRLADDDFFWVQREIMAVACDVCGGRVVSVVEGGYNLKAIARSAVEAVRAQVEAAEEAAASAGGGGGGGSGGGGGGDCGGGGAVGVLSASLRKLAVGVGGAYSSMDLPPKDNEDEDEDDDGEGSNGGDGGDEDGGDEWAEGGEENLAAAVLAGFGRCKTEGVLRSDPTHMLRR